VNALERTDTIEDFKREYGKTRSLVAVNRTLGILRHAMNWGRGRTPAIFVASPFIDSASRSRPRARRNGIVGFRPTKSDSSWKRPTSSIAPSTRSRALRCVIE
jgi:hypothetical protein